MILLSKNSKQVQYMRRIEEQRYMLSLLIGKNKTTEAEACIVEFAATLTLPNTITIIDTIDLVLADVREFGCITKTSWIFKYKPFMK